MREGALTDVRPHASARVDRYDDPLLEDETQCRGSVARLHEVYRVVLEPIQLSARNEARVSQGEKRRWRQGRKQGETGTHVRNRWQRELHLEPIEIVAQPAGRDEPEKKRQRGVVSAVGRNVE